MFEDRYELLEVLGAGGIGTVYKARQLDSGRLLALKLLHRQFAEDDEFKQRFLREAQALNKLNHDHIVRVYHLGVAEDGTPYLAMELVEGVTLRKVLENGKLSPTRAIAITKMTCSALSLMHNEGVIHRDLKPDNIVLMSKPEPDYVKIIDFGLARIADPANDSQKLTNTGLLLGSANYMSPEQCRGNKADARSDIYALTICLFEMLTGRCPFIADNAVGLMYKHLNEETPTLHASDTKPFHPAINAFIHKGMQKDPAKRFQTSAEMAADLESLGETLSQNQSNGTRLSPRVLLIGTTLLLISLAALYAVSTIKAEKREQTATFAPQKHHYMARSAHRDLKRLRLNELLEVGNNLSEDRLVRCEAFSLYSWMNRYDKKGLDAITKAVDLYNSQPEGRLGASIGMATELRLMYGEVLTCNSNYGKAISEIEKLLADHERLGVQERLKCISLLAYANAQLGNIEKALNYLKQLDAWEYGIDYPASHYATEAEIKLGRLDLAKKLIYKVTNIGSLADMALQFRNQNAPELADLCVTQGALVAAPMSPLINRPASKQSEVDFAFAIEQIWSAIRHHKFRQAEETIQKITQNDDFAELRTRVSWVLQLGLAYENLGHIDEALNLLKAPSSNENQTLRLLKGDLLTRKQEYEQAQKYIDADALGLDPETLKLTKIIDRLNTIKAGRGNYRKGLLLWLGTPNLSEQKTDAGEQKTKLNGKKGAL